MTSDIADAGSNSAFYYTFVGTKGQTGEHIADNIGDDRVQARSDTWKISDDADIGEFKCLRIRMDGHGGWHIDTVSNILRLMKRIVMELIKMSEIWICCGKKSTIEHLCESES